MTLAEKAPRLLYLLRSMVQVFAADVQIPVLVEARLLVAELLSSPLPSPDEQPLDTPPERAPQADRPPNYGRALRVIRAFCWLSRSELAELVGLSPSHIGAIESGRRRPSEDAIVALAEVVGLSVDQFRFMSMDTSTADWRRWSLGQKDKILLALLAAEARAREALAAAHGDPESGGC